MPRQWPWLLVPAAATTALFALVAMLGTGSDGDDSSLRRVTVRTTTRLVEVPATARTAERTQPSATTTLQDATTTAEPRPARLFMVPDFRGLTEERAVARVEAAGFQPAVRRVRSFQPDGTVIEQRPRPGVRASRGRTVRLVVSVLKPRTPPPQRTVTPPPLSR
jgi:hypothetical protein